MAREAICHTPSGLPFWVEWEGYDEHWADEGIQVSAVLRCRWDDRLAWKAEMKGFTSWDGVSGYLNRHVPVTCPYDRLLVCSDLKFVSRGLGAADGSNQGAFPSGGETIADDTADGWPRAGYVKYLATFRRRLYAISPDEDGFSNLTVPEYQRYLTTSRQEVAREQQLGSLQLVDAADHNQLVNSKAFLPDHTYTIRATWHQVPVDAVPWAAIALSTNRVNNGTLYFPFGDTGSTQDLVPFSLLFKGLPDDTKPYAGADGGLYVDLHYLFDWRPTVQLPPGGTPDPLKNYFGWNGFRLPSGKYIQLAVKSPDGSFPPPYVAVDHSKLFVPGFAG